MLSILNVCGTCIRLHQIRILAFRLKKISETYRRGHSVAFINTTVVTGKKYSSQSSRLQTEMAA